MARKSSQVKLKTLSRYATIDKKKQKKADIFYVLLTTAAFAAIAAGMIILPRSDESELEQRKLAKFPELTRESLLSGSFSDEVTAVFSDTVPMRDTLMEIASVMQEFTGFRSNNIKLHNVALAENTEPVREFYTETAAAVTETEIRVTELSEEKLGAEAVNPAETKVPESVSTIETEPLPETEAPPEDDNVNILNNGIAVVGTRAIMLYGGNYTVGEDYANVIVKYKEALGKDVNVYCMVIPTSSEFYCPESVSPYNGSQLDNIRNIYASLITTDVRTVDAYSALRLHTNENIYFRTDHHWSSLGAYYAAREFASAAEVPFLELSDYDKRTVEGYVGTMYSYTQDIAIKNNPEDFFYYVPKDVEFNTTYYNYILGDGNAIIGIDKPINANFFLDFSNSKSMLYCTFMGGDAKITHNNTSTGNGRRLAIFKDSYGNALPQFLFGSFEDIYIIDMRYFTYNAVDYLKEKGITDVLFANNAFHATTRSTVTYYERLLTQGKQVKPAETTVTTTVPAVTAAVPAVTDGTTVTQVTTGTSAAQTQAAAQTTTAAQTTVTTVTSASTSVTEASPAGGTSVSGSVSSSGN